MNIFVINLTGAFERRQFQKQQLIELGLEYKILNAVSIDDISNETYKKVVGKIKKAVGQDKRHLAKIHGLS